MNIKAASITAASSGGSLSIAEGGTATFAVPQLVVE